MAPRKKITDFTPKVTLKRPQNFKKPSPKTVEVKIGSPVALAQLQAQSNLISPKKAKTPAKQTISPNTVKKPVKRCTPNNKKTNNKTTKVNNADVSMAQSEKLHTPITRKSAIKITEIHSVHDSEIAQEQKKKRPRPKSRIMLEVKKKTANPVRKAKNKTGKKTQPKSGKSVNLSQEIGSDKSSDILNKEELAASEAVKNVGTPIKRPRGRPKGSTKAKSKILKAKVIKDAVPMLEKVLQNPSPPEPNNRPNSVISNVSNLTWSKYISTESSSSLDPPTSVTVTSKDCERFINKVEQLENPDQPKIINDNLKQLTSEISRDESSSSDSDSSSSSSSSDSELGGTDTRPELNLSTSSLTSTSPRPDANTDLCSQRVKNLNKCLDDFHADISKLRPLHNDYLCTDSNVLKGVDPDIDDIINKCDNFDSDLEDMFQQTNKPEKSLVHHRTVEFTEQNESDNRNLEDSRRSSYEYNHSETSSPERYRLCQRSVHNDTKAKFANTCLVRRSSAVNSRDTAIDLPNKQLFSNINREEASPTDSFKTFTSDDYNYVPFDRTHDDDDALSLYAESISGMESSKQDSVASVSNVTLHDLYVPKYPPTSCMRETYVYRPTKLQVHRNNNAGESTEDRIISNADDKEKEPDRKPKEISGACVSSSGSRDMNKSALELKDSNRISSHAEESIKRTEAQISSQSRRPFSSYTTINPVKSSLYRGVCFFYIASQCKNGNCRFPHVIIDLNTFKYRLTNLNDDNLISEYLLMCIYGPLKRKFCLLFIEECKRRTATRILFEMTIDLALGFVEIDEDLRVKVLETALLHLNTINIDACDDLLKFEHKNTMLCDTLISCMANSQNFAQFKQAFVKLANLMCELNRPVDIQVASSILERVCILPGEEIIARGMLTLMENTDVSIFESNLAKYFEIQLSMIDSDVHEMYLLAKKAAHQGSLAQTTPLLKPRVPRNGPRQTSPDSTNVDNLPEPVPPVKSASRRFLEPRLPLWRRSRYNSRGLRSRGRNITRTRGGAYTMQVKI